jgi:hypothetical protein
VSIDGQRQNIGKSRRRRLIALAPISCLLVYVWFFWFQTAMLILNRYSYRNFPLASITPVELTDHRIASGNGSEVSCFGYDFEVPWQDIDTQKVRREVMVLIPFRSGLDILVGHGSTHNLVDTTVESTKTDMQHFRALYGDKAAQSDYEFLQLVLNTTPGSIRLVDSKQDVGRKTTLLVFKALIAAGDDPSIFMVQANGFRGFQYGDPSKHPKRITVTLYSADGGIEFSFARKDMQPLAISQAEINRAIQTLRYNGLAETAQK